MKYVRLFSFLAATLFWASGNAQTLPQFNIVKPSTTGVPCDEVRVMGFDPAGNLWIGGRWVFWGEAAEVYMFRPVMMSGHALQITTALPLGHCARRPVVAILVAQNQPNPGKQL